MLQASIFRMYDIRGRALTELTVETAELVGQALGTKIRRAGAVTAAVGRDVRHSSPRLAAAAAAGLAKAGIRVSDLGVVPTPVLYHALHRRSLGGGIMVTGSHNPREDNGLKVCLGASSLYGEGITSLRTMSEARDFETGNGTIESCPHLADYERDLVPRFSFERRFRVGVDCGNGVMGPVVIPILERLQIEVVPLYCEPDGDFPNHLPDPEVPKYMADLAKLVVAKGLDMGLGFDGDGDRVGILDERGRKISADWIVALFAKELLATYPGGKIRFDVKCSDFLTEEVRRLGGIPVMGETGHSLLKRDVKKEDAILGGELSGHIVFNRGYVPIDDSLYSALYFLGILDRRGGVVSDLFRTFPKLASTAEIKVPCPDDRKFRVVAELVRHFQSRFEVLDLDGARVRVPGGWFLVRASNTTPNLTVRFEARDQAALDSACGLLLEALRPFPEVQTAVLTEETRP